MDSFCSILCPWRFYSLEMEQLFAYCTLTANTLSQQESWTVRCMYCSKHSRKDSSWDLVTATNSAPKKSLHVSWAWLIRMGQIFRVMNYFSSLFLEICRWENRSLQIWIEDQVFALRMHRWNLMDVWFRCRFRVESCEELTHGTVEC